MKIIKPITITDAMFTSSTAPETDYTAWNSGTAYVVGNRCIRVSTHRCYECLVNNTNFTPETNLTGATPKWLDLGPTNKWAMLDDKWGTATTIATPLTVVLSPWIILDSIALLNVTAETVTINVTVDGSNVYSKSVAMVSGGGILDWYAYFFSEITYISDVVFTDLLPYLSGIITIGFTASSGNVSCGNCILGSYYQMGSTQYGATSGIIDYSAKTVDAFGNTTITQRTYSKRMTSHVIVDNTIVDDVIRTLADYRSTPLVWIGADNIFTNLIVYGFYKDFDVNISYPYDSDCTLTIEGLT